MNNEELQVYTARITQANRSELVVIVYEIILSDLASAKKSYGEGNLTAFEKDLKHAQKSISELMRALDFKYKLSLDLMQLYMYSNKRIITALLKKKPDTLDSVEKVIRSLLIGFEGVTKEDQSGPVMQNTQQLYAGLTYGKGTLNETFIDPKDQFRGFKA